MNSLVILDGAGAGSGVEVQQSIAQVKVLLRQSTDGDYITLIDAIGDEFMVRRDIVDLVTPVPPSSSSTPIGMNTPNPGGSPWTPTP